MVPQLRVMQDVETRWWSVHASLNRLIYLKSATRHLSPARPTYSLHASFPSCTGLLSRSLVPLVEPFALIQPALEAETYITVSLVIPNIPVLNLGLRDAMVDLQAELLAKPAHKVQERSIGLPCDPCLPGDLSHRWGNGSAFLQCSTGPARVSNIKV